MEQEAGEVDGDRENALLGSFGDLPRASNLAENSKIGDDGAEVLTRVTVGILIAGDNVLL